MGGGYEFDFSPGYPRWSTTRPSPSMSAAMPSVMGDKAVIAPHSALGGEDFAFFGEKVPISYFWLGVDSPHIKSAPIHNAGFNPDEHALSYGCQTLCNAALRFLNE